MSKIYRIKVRFATELTVKTAKRARSASGNGKYQLFPRLITVESIRYKT